MCDIEERCVTFKVAEFLELNFGASKIGPFQQ